MAKVQKKSYDLIASIGVNCGCSGFLRRCKLQYASLPFDWNFCASFDEHIRTIVNDFAGFLDLQKLQFTPKEDEEKSDRSCDYYRNTQNGFLFLHDFPIGVPLNESYPAVREKYQRRIGRLYRRIAKAQKVLFVWFCAQDWLETEQVIEAQRQLAQKFPKQRVDILVVENDKNLSDITEEQLSDNIIRIRYNMFSNKTGNPLSDVMGNMALGEQAFGRFKLRQPWWFKSARKLLYCIPNRRIRKKLRHKIYNHD